MTNDDGYRPQDARFDRRDDDCITIKQGGGCLALFGLPFLAAGLFVMSTPFLPHLQSRGGNAPPLVFALCFGLIFACVGAALVFGRGGIVIDRRERTVRKWWGLLVPFKTDYYPLEQFSGVRLTQEVRHSKKSTYTVYPVRLIGSGKPLPIEESRDQEAARRRAEAIAKFVNLGLEDSSSGTMVRREAGTLDESLRDRLLRTGQKVELPEKPEGCRARFHVAGDQLVIDLPPAGFGVAQIGMMVVGLVFPALVCLVFLGPMSAGTPPPLFFTVFIGLFFVLLPLAGFWGPAIMSATARDRITVSSDALQVERRGMLFTKTTRIPMDEMEELEVAKGAGSGRSLTWGSGPAILARSDRASVGFGGGLSEKEVRWLYDVIRYMAVTKAG